MQVRSTDTTQVSDGLLAAHTHTLHTYRDTLRVARTDTTYATPEAALASPGDRRTCEEAEAIARDLGGSLKTVLLVGIGGSDLGTRAVYDAVRYGVPEGPRLITYGTLEQKLLVQAQDLISTHEHPEELVLIVVSKSGTTTETLMNAGILYETLSARFGEKDAANRTICISDANAQIAPRIRQAHIRHLTIPEQIGGRYSVFTAVCLTPLALLGIDIRSFCEGAEAAVRAAVPETGPGPAAVLAALLFEQYLNGTTIHELFLFHPELETLGTWYRQLLAESIGKERADGTRVGIMPTVAIGSTDLHSLAQLIIGGPKNRFTTFVSAPTEWSNTKRCPDEGPFAAPMVSGREVGEVMRAIYDGVRTTYKNHGLPFISIDLAGIVPRELGAFMGLHMAMVMYLGTLFDINPFNQPAVESYKDEVRRQLGS